MIQDQRDISIHAAPEAVFDWIETMPNKFPVYKILETKPFLFLRILFVDGFRSAMEAVGIEKPEDEWILQVGDSFGAFTLTESQRPFRYWFTLNSFFFHCRTGYSLRTRGEETILNFDLIAENPSFKEKVYWFFIKPFHAVFANKVLRVIKKAVERRIT